VTKLAPDRLAGHHVVGFLWARTGRGVPYAMHSGDESVKVQGRYALSVDECKAYFASGLAGPGILSMPDYMAKPHLANAELVPLFTLNPMPLYIAFPPNRQVKCEVAGVYGLGSRNNCRACASASVNN